jgi:hypothetical protein
MFGERIFVYFLPTFLIALEWFMRAAFSLETELFIGPILASVGLTFLVPLTIPKKTHHHHHQLSKQMREELERLQFTVIPKRERRFIQLCWSLMLIFILAWLSTLYLSTLPGQYLWRFPISYYPGFFNAFVGILLS